MNIFCVFRGETIIIKDRTDIRYLNYIMFMSEICKNALIKQKLFRCTISMVNKINEIK